MNDKIKAVKPSPTQTLRARFQALSAELNGRVLERHEMIKGMIIALLTRLNIFFLGRPGTAKSYLSVLVCRALADARFFEILMRKDTRFEEIFGVPKFSQLPNDRFVYNTANRLTEATIAFLDEIWKSSSAVLNGLLTAVNERKFTNDGVAGPIPLEVTVSCSNELPEDKGLDALWERFHLRYEAKYLQDQSNFERLLDLDEEDKPMQISITIDELHAAQAEVKAIVTSQKGSSIKTILSGLRTAFLAAGMEFSERTWRLARKVLAASAWLDGRTTVELQDAEPLVAMFWNQPAQIREVKSIILAYSNPDLKAVLELLDSATEIKTNALAAKDATAAGLEAAKKMKEILTRMNALTKSVRRDEAIEQVKAMHREVMQSCLGLT